MTNALVKLGTARSMLAKSTTLDEVKKIRDMAETARTYAKAAHLERVTQNEAAEIALMAARKAGTILKQLQKTRPQSAAKVAGDSEYRKALRDTGTPDRTATYWQRLSEVTEFIAQQYFAKVRNADKGDITAAGLLREANKIGRLVASGTEFSPQARKSAKETGHLGIFPLDMLESFSKVKGLAAKFGAPPFSTLDLRQSYWSDRKREWEALGISGSAGRGGEHESVYDDRLGTFDTDISEFNPAVAETMYDWFTPKRGNIFDPFAGGSTRGVVATIRGYKYTGIELRGEQINENHKQIDKIRRDWGPTFPSKHSPIWIEGDSAELSNRLAGQEFDLIFTCPPYWNRERYTKDDDRDLSRCKTYEEFIRRYEDIFRQAVAHLKDNRFAVVVIADIRDKRGWCLNLVGDTISCFQRLGLHYYNHLILLDPIGNSAQRVGKQFTHYRKVQKAHQNILVFLKGDSSGRIPDELGVLEEVTALGPGNGVPPPTVQSKSDPDLEMMVLSVVEGPMFNGISNEPPVQESRQPKENDLTPVERHGDKWVKRDDLFTIAGVSGGKARTCWHLAQDAPGLVTAGSRSSPQVNIVAQIAKHLGIPARAHTPQGELSPELLDAQSAGCTIIQHRAGYNNVIIARARKDASARGWLEVPFGMECDAAVQLTRGQVVNVPREVKRLVMPVGSGMSLAGVLWGMKDCGLTVQVLGVRVGADPRKQLAKYAPPGWEEMVKLVDSGSDYHKPADKTRLGNIALDPIYEGKCVPFLKPGDLFWIVGIRRTAAIVEGYGEQLDRDQPVAIK